MRRIRPLLRHAIHYWELTLLMGERTGVRTEWLERTRADLGRMRSTLLEANREIETAASTARRKRLCRAAPKGPVPRGAGAEPRAGLQEGRGGTL